MQTPPRDTLRLVIFDLDGVVYRGSRAVRGVPQLIRWLHEQPNLSVRFATNNSMLPPRAFVARLAALGIAAAPDEIVTSTTATIEHLKRHLPDVRRILAVGEPGLAKMLRGAGYEVTRAAKAVGSTYAGQPLDATYDLVVAGLDLSFRYSSLAAAMTAIAAGAGFVATNADARYPTEHGFVPGAGSMVASICVASGVEPTVIGKPQPAMFASILEHEQLAPGAALVVGDNPDADIVAARRAGIPSVLVLTGVADAGMAESLNGERRPDAVAPAPSDLQRLIEARL